jgi:hypothetical protein
VAASFHGATPTTGPVVHHFRGLNCRPSRCGLGTGPDHSQVVCHGVPGPAQRLGAVLLYRYVNVPMLGPFPAMYEPVWFPEAVAALVAGAAALLSGRFLLATCKS